MHIFTSGKRFSGYHFGLDFHQKDQLYQIKAKFHKGGNMIYY